MRPLGPQQAFRSASTNTATLPERAQDDQCTKDQADAQDELRFQVGPRKWQLRGITAAGD
jgi:hypothetical protein